jgi:hypothetical protein
MNHSASWLFLATVFRHHAALENPWLLRQKKFRQAKDFDGRLAPKTVMDWGVEVNPAKRQRTNRRSARSGETFSPQDGPGSFKLRSSARRRARRDASYQCQRHSCYNHEDYGHGGKKLLMGGSAECDRGAVPAPREIRTPRSPSPLIPLPKEREDAAGTAGPKQPSVPRRRRRCPLSPGERVGVRGKEPSLRHSLPGVFTGHSLGVAAPSALGPFVLIRG